MKRRIAFLGILASGTELGTTRWSERNVILNASSGTRFRGAMSADAELRGLANLFLDNGDLVFVA